MTYIPEPLRTFLDRLRLDLVKDCRPNAHVTILPPQPLPEHLGPELAWKLIQGRICDLPSFEIQATEVKIFEKSPVVYIAIGKGYQELVEMHNALHAEPLHAEEQFPYEPHITLAQDLEPHQLQEVCAMAHQRWAEFPYSRSFPVDILTFVQNTTRNHWLDLARCSLAAVATPR